MKIAMFTNAYDPYIGGLVRSIKTFAEDLREAGHEVLIVTLAFSGATESTETVFRLPSIKEVAGTAYSAKLPLPNGLSERMDAFAPDIIHSHHPFMLGDSALRVARRRNLPLVFTHHTLYERYAYQFSHDSQLLERVALLIATEYANLCNLVIAPTGSISQLIQERGVKKPIRIIPTGIDVKSFSQGERTAFREKYDLPHDAFVLGYLGRVVAAKNMHFIAQAVIAFLTGNPDARFLMVGEGDAEDAVMQAFRAGGVAERVVRTGSLSGSAVADAYAAMDLFAFASKTETQGIVLIESLCAGVPVVALDALGTRDIVEHQKSGLILAGDASPSDLAEALDALYKDSDRHARLRDGAQQRARVYDRKHCAERLLDAYKDIKQEGAARPDEQDGWDHLQQRFAAEWSLLKEKFTVIMGSFSDEEDASGPPQASSVHSTSNKSDSPI